MNDIVLVNETHIDVPPPEAFARFGRTDAAGWMFSAQVGEMRPGSAVSVEIPLPHARPGSGASVRGTARIVEARPYRRIVLLHETPWTGRVTLTFTPEPGGTRMRAVAELDENALDWISGRLWGSSPGDGGATPDEVRIALLTSLSGGAGLFGRAAANCFTLAAREINEQGGIHGRPVHVDVIDDQTDGATALTRLRGLNTRAGLAAVVGVHTSATLDAVSGYARKSGLPYLYTAANEGTRRQVGTLFRLGESASDQLTEAIPALMRETGGRGWYLLGNDYCWPREVSRVGRKIVESNGGRVVGERHVPLREAAFDEVLEDIVSRGADLVLSSLVGWSSIDFERQFYAAGLRSRIRTVAALMDESTREHLGVAASGLWSCLPYFATLDTVENTQFLRRYRAAFGPWAPSPSAITESAYEGLHLFARAAHRARSLDAVEVTRALRGLAMPGPRGRVEVGADGRLRQNMYLAEATPTGFTVRAEMRPGLT